MSKRTKVSRVDKFYQDENTLGMFDDTFDTLCWADFADRFPCDGQVHVDVRLMYAYPMLVRVWEEVLRYVETPTFEPMEIKILPLGTDKVHESDSLCNPDMIYKRKCRFEYKTNIFKVMHCKGMGWFISNEDE